MLPIFAIGGYTFAQLAIALVVILAVAGIVVVVAKNSGIPIPPWIWQIAWIVLLAVVAIVAIRFVLSL